MRTRGTPTLVAYRPVISPALEGEHRGLAEKCVNLTPSFPRLSIFGVGMLDPKEPISP
jgi:hypothetical protein